MAARVVTGEGLVRWDHERIALKADDVLIVCASANLLGLQLMLFLPAAAVQLDPDRHGVAIAAHVVSACSLDRYGGECQDSDHCPDPSEPLATHRRPPREAHSL
jgi:hypothetical protein